VIAALIAPPIFGTNGFSRGVKNAAGIGVFIDGTGGVGMGTAAAGVTPMEGLPIGTGVGKIAGGIWFEGGRGGGGWAGKAIPL